ncbi:sigma 54-interacting transcriptional regulator [Clostridium beijerinckii]|uniref:sigma 54-interacting transcriptional regulator n=1 Tax=Clostridium beijerinckii TaxID=1520 RepID=UPI00047DD9D4|nr:sigma 54-interacting transcriptional regulator [Clostridium beijerinckii]
MKRIDKIYNYVLKNSKNFNKDKFLEQNGFSAQEIGQKLNILRNNVSKELNILCREKKIIKIKNRPVMYFDRSYLENILSIRLPKDLEEISDISTLLSSPSNTVIEDQSPFNYLIGASTCLKNQIEQAKAALMYPPNGLHTLIIGGTGVGKSIFANMMYKYSKYIKKLSEDAPFVVFNCADYANDPKLLLSYILGHIKGAFTGADKDTDGIISRADGGILFLDEIHRLPPECQETVFHFMDTGTYNKLGETDRTRRANVLLIGATTEYPNSTLLNTFIRRIPITITIPSFDERPIDDQIKLVHYLISKEAQRVNKAIKISAEAIKALIGSTSYRNVGQLKSNIQLACAKGFLNSINTDDCIDINLNLLPPNLKSGILAFSNKIKDNATVWDIIPNAITIQPDGDKTFLETDAYEPPFNIYNIIQDKTSALQEEGMSDDDIKNFISIDINIHLKQFYARFKNDTHRLEGLLKIVDKDIVEFAEEIKALAETRLNRKLNERFIYATSLHFSALFNRIKKKTVFFPSHIQLQPSINSKEYEVATEINELIKKRYNLALPPIEISYLALLFTSIQDSSHQERVGIVVAAHGSSTATSMVAVARKLFDADNILAVDMPLEMNPSDILETVIEKVKIVDEGKGVLLLVDMGSLNSFCDAITERTGINTKSIDMVSTPLVLEAVRKCSLCDTDLNSIYSYLITDFRGYTNKVITEECPNIDGTIVTICSTGEGAAIKLKELVQDIVDNIRTNNINIIPIGLKDLSKSITHISKSNKIIALIGISNPNIGIPFISLEKLIDGSGEKVLKNLINGETIIDTNDTKTEKQIVLKSLCKQSLRDLLTYLNPEKICPLLEDFVITIENFLCINYQNPVKLRIMLHVACSLERMILNDGLVYRKPIDTLNKNTLSALKKASLIFKNSLSINLTNDELYYMVDIFNEF